MIPFLTCLFCFLLGMFMDMIFSKDAKTDGEDNKIYIGDILDETRLSTDVELELSYDVWEAVWSMRLNPFEWTLHDGKGGCLRHKNYHVSYQEESVYSFLNKITGDAIELKSIDHLALVAQRDKLIEFLDKVKRDNEILQNDGNVRGIGAYFNGGRIPEKSLYEKSYKY